MKKFSQLAIPYIVWAVLMLVLPMALIFLYSITEPGNSIISFSITLDQYIKFFTDKDFLLILWRSLAIAVKTTIICLPAWLSDCILHCKNKRKNTEPVNFMHYNSNVDQHACAYLCVDWSLK